MARIKWSDEAIKDFWRLHQFLHSNSPEAARKMTSAVLIGSQGISKVPDRGKLVDDNSGRRELYLVFGGGYYILRYHIDQQGVPIVLRVWHSREERNPVQ